MFIARIPSTANPRNTSIDWTRSAALTGAAGAIAESDFLRAGSSVADTTSYSFGETNAVDFFSFMIQPRDLEMLGNEIGRGLTQPTSDDSSAVRNTRSTQMYYHAKPEQVSEIAVFPVDVPDNGFN